MMAYLNEEMKELIVSPTNLPFHLPIPDHLLIPQTSMQVNYMPEYTIDELMNQY